MIIEVKVFNAPDFHYGRSLKISNIELSRAMDPESYLRCKFQILTDAFISELCKGKSDAQITRMRVNVRPERK